MRPESIAIITARGGSKRIPRKNIKNFLGAPIIKYSITAALESGCFDEVMVSTDDKEIADIARSYGAQVPFLRSEKNSNDYAGTPDVIIEVLEEYKKRGREFDYCCAIYPTAPFITPLTLQDSFNKLQENKGYSLVPVVRYSFPIQRALRIDDGTLKMFQPEFFRSRSQDLEPSYHDAGQFYWLDIPHFLEENTLYTSRNIPFERSEMEVQDIDTEDDWQIAELKYQIISSQR